MADEETTPTVDEGAAEAPSVVQDAPGFDWGEYADNDIVKRHGGDPTKILQSHESLQREFHARNQAPPDPAAEPEVPWEPLQGVSAPAGVDPVFYARVEQSYRMDPVGTFRELLAGGDEYTVYAEEVYAALEGSIGKLRTAQLFNQIQAEQQSAQYEQMLQEQVEERVTPLQNEATFSKVDSGIALAKGVMGDEAWAKFEPYLRDITDPAKGGGPMPPHVVNDPALMRDTLLKLQQWQLFNEQAALDAAATAPPATAPPARRGAQSALSGNTASRPEDETEAQRIKRSVRETKIRVTD